MLTKRRNTTPWSDVSNGSCANTIIQVMYISKKLHCGKTAVLNETKLSRVNSRDSLLGKMLNKLSMNTTYAAKERAGEQISPNSFSPTNRKTEFSHGNSVPMEQGYES